MKKNKTVIKAEIGAQEIFITREFDAPPELVFKLYTDPQLIIHWLGGQCDLTLQIEMFNAQRGGSYRYIHIDPTGKKYVFRGVFHQCISPQLIIRTFEFEGFPEKSNVILEIIRFEALPKKRTRVVLHSVFQSVADRDSMLKSGMLIGVTDSHARLDDLIENCNVNAENFIS